jgi:hypothetical protein
VPTVLIDSVPFKHGLFGPALSDAVVRIKTAKIITKSRTNDLLKSIKAADPVAAAHFRDELINGPDARLVSAIVANKKLRPDRRQTLEKCLLVPTLLDLSKPLTELVPVYPKAKKSGGVRMIHNFGLLHRTSQDMVSRVMGVYYKPRYFQFTERGVHAAVKSAKAALGAGHVHVARLDIENFYPSFDPEKLASELPLPQEVVDNVVLGRHMKVVMDQEQKVSHAGSSLPHTLNDLLLLARLGIPLGSASSPIVASHRVSQLMWLHRDGVTLVNYADDFLLLSSSVKLLDKAVGGLTAVVAKLPGGHFELILKATSDAMNGFDFLGHSIRIVAGKLITSPTEANTNHIWMKITEIDEQLSNLVYAVGKNGKYDKQKALTLLARMLAIVDGWSSAFSECDDPKQMVEPLICGVKEWAAKLEVSPDQIKQAIEPYMEYKPVDYALGH